MEKNKHNLPIMAIINARKNTCIRGHPFNNENTNISYRKARPQRRCKKCISILKKQWRSREWAKEYSIYTSAKGRCLNKNNQQYKHYGARGIKFLFKNFEEFKNVLGKRPHGMELDRIDNDGHYEPNNVRWATHGQNMRNRRSFVLSKDQIKEIIETKGLTRTSIAKKYGVSSHTIVHVFEQHGLFLKPWETLK